MAAAQKETSPALEVGASEWEWAEALVSAPLSDWAEASAQ
jgi:hypothetical protein